MAQDTLRIVCIALPLQDSDNGLGRFIALHVEFDETGQMIRLKNVLNETTTTMAVMAAQLRSHATQ